MLRKRTIALTFSKNEMSMSLKTGGFNIAPVEGGLQKFLGEKAVAEDFLLDFITNNNIQSYHEGADGTNIVPKPEDFYMAEFRLLSAGIVAAGSWRSTNFGADSNALKASLSKLANKPLHTEHETGVSNVVGLAMNPYWDSEKQADKEFAQSFNNGWDGKIPAGINATLAIDAKTHPQLARAVASDSVVSNSVQVVFDFVQSHDISEDEFDSRVVDVDDDGKMITRNVTFIHDYFETSLVWLGADPFAKKLDGEGNLINVDGTHVFPFSFGSHQKGEKKSKNTLISKPYLLYLRNNKKQGEKTTDSMDQLQQIAQALGIDSATKPTVEQITQAVSNLQSKADASKTGSGSYSGDASNKDTENLTKQIEDLKVKYNTDVVALQHERDQANASLESYKSNYQELKEKHDSFLKEKRDKVIELYNQFTENKPKEVMVNLINSANSEQLDAFLEEYGAKTYQKFGATCKDCGSTSITMKQSVTKDDKGSDDKSEKEPAFSLEDIFQKKRNNK